MKNDKPQQRIQSLLEEGLALHRRGQFDAARKIYEDVHAQDARQFDALYLLGVLAAQTNDMPRAAAFLKEAVFVNPSHAPAQNNLGGALAALGKSDDALEAYNDALMLKADYAEAHHGRARVLANLRRYDESLAAFVRAVEINPNDVEAHNARGLILAGQHRHDDALTAFKASLLLKPDDPRIHNARGQSLHYLNRYKEASEAYDNALALKPDYAEAWSNRGAALAALKYLPLAVESYDRALALKPDYVAAVVNRGHALLDLNRFEEAAASYELALRLRPDFAFLRGPRLHARLQACLWDNLDADLSDLATRIGNSEKATPPWVALVLFDDPILHHTAARTWAETYHPSRKPDVTHSAPAQKIRLGYFSADFHDHATTRLMAELFERHNRRRFELTAFSFGPDKKDFMRERVVNAFDRFVDVSSESDDRIAELARDFEIDIAVDLKGYTQDSRPGIFARRAAPMQVSYIGYPGSMAAEYIDYIVADRTIVPQAYEPYYSEKIVRLPHSYQVNDRRRVIAPRVFSRTELSLPEQGFVFCCFNHSFKILPHTFAIWMNILRAVPGSVLWLLEDYPPATDRLRRYAAAQGIEPKRLVFAKRMPQSEHLARLHAADMVLDTLPCNAHTTASDALWAGVPVLTCLGHAFAGRVAASLLKAVGLPELVVDTADAYEMRAIALALDPESLGRLKERLSTNIRTAPLFDTALLAQHLEAAYEQMYARYQSGLPADHITVAP